LRDSNSQNQRSKVRHFRAADEHEGSAFSRRTSLSSRKYRQAVLHV
jgi:hypothetical protein